MNRNQIRGGFKDAAGKIQKKFGQMVGSERHEAEGTMTQAEGKTQKTAGDVTDSLAKTADSIKDKLRK